MAAIPSYSPSYFDKLFDNELINGNLFPQIDSSYNLDKDYYEIFTDYSSHSKQCISIFPSTDRQLSNLFLIFFHGNSCDIGDCVKKLRTYSVWLNCTVIGIEYSGYGCSIGERTQSAIINRCVNSIFYLSDQKKIPLSKMILFGQSIGCAIVLKLNTIFKSQFHGIILLSPFANLKKVAEYHNISASFLITESTLSNIDEIKVMKKTQYLLIIHGKKDEIIPFVHSQILYDHSPLEPDKNKFLYFQEKASHNVFDKDSFHWDILLPFFRLCEQNVKDKSKIKINIIEIDEKHPKIYYKNLRKKQNDVWLKEDGNVSFECDFDDNKIYKYGITSALNDIL